VTPTSTFHPIKKSGLAKSHDSKEPFRNVKTATQASASRRSTLYTHKKNHKSPFRMSFFPHHLERSFGAFGSFTHKILFAATDLASLLISILTDSIMAKETNITISPQEFQLKTGSRYLWRPLTVILIALNTALYFITRSSEAYYSIDHHPVSVYYF